ncbi:DUF2085 domain-containing protein [Kallotenue papyrolyticum]|uniref:DUF2085 domain-containing protein n=1 Tax=Kallotenue papyrolyticum TaxID=1325125 RepID=UPI00046FC8E6|nr:DUF2085 domain-containing protein [Kallotenue papyrolyticum]
MSQIDPTLDILELARREMAQRRRAELEAAAARQQPWLWALVGLLATLLIGLLVLPLGTLADRLRLVVHGVCAQQHYLYIGGVALPLCARNSGIYAGFLATLLYLLALGRGRAAKAPPLSITLTLLAAILVMGVDGFNSLLLDLGGYNLYAPDNRLRVITGLGMGVALGVLLPLLFNLSLRYDARREQRILGSWIELAGALLVAAVLFALLFWAPAWLYYPLALFSVAGIVSVLWLANTFVLGMLGGLEGRVLRLRQLARPATLGLLLTVGELALLAWLRMQLEHTLLH